METEKIDIVITWVDDSDQAWLAERLKFQESNSSLDDSENRYRDWGLFKYVFRGLEKNAPWVNKIHLVTCGHLPAWLNINHPKLNIVKHTDFIPQKYLPTFNSNTIDWNLFRIPELAEKFVLFNDDTFLISETKSTDFFYKGLPCGTPTLEPFKVIKNDWFFTPATNCAILNDYFTLRASFKKRPLQWLNYRYGFKNNLSTLLMLAYPSFYGFHCYHLPNSFLKSTFKTIWGYERALLDKTCCNKFRDPKEPNQWLAETWQYASGKFKPRKAIFGKCFQMGEYSNDLESVCKYIVSKEGKCICINDSQIDAESYRAASLAVQKAFNALFPLASNYELEES